MILHIVSLLESYSPTSSTRNGIRLAASTKRFDVPFISIGRIAKLAKRSVNV